jgi:hypothetical protein
MKKKAFKYLISNEKCIEGDLMVCYATGIYSTKKEKKVGNKKNVCIFVIKNQKYGKI